MEKPRTSASWLQLIAEDAPASAIVALRSAALAAARPADRASIEAEAEHALELRELFAERSQRALELTALHEITSQLTALRDPERLLQDIATKAKELLGVDISYLALAGEDGHLAIRVAAGSMGTRLRGLVMSSDVGLVGEVLTSGRPYWTADYTNDPSITHTDVTDDAAREEGLGGILGVPLRVREDVIGVLFAADRKVRTFDDSEVALLSSLASHAAAAIDNARLYDSLRETASELEVANIDLRDKVAAIDRAATLHEQLTGIVVRGGGVAEVLAALSNVLGDDVVFRLPEDLDEVVAEALGGRGGRVVRGTRVVATEGRPTTTVPVLVGEDVLAWLLVERDLSASDADLRQLERAALVMALVLVRDRALRAAELRSRHELVAALLRDEGSPESLQRRALAAGLRPARAHVVVVFAQEDGGAAAAAAEGVVVEFGGIASEFERAAVAIVEASDEGEVAAWIRREQRGLAGTAGVANAAPGIASLGAAHGEAKRCVAAAATLGRQGDVVAPADLGVYRFLLGSSEASETAQFIARILAPLDEADQVRRTELVATVEAYLVSGRHHSATAEALHIHPNTLYQRLARIDEVLGDDWREAERSLELQLALRLRTMTTALTEAAGS